MKALCIIGSPKTNGSTARLVDRVIEGMESLKIKVSRYFLDEMNINYCKGCEKCEVDRKCVQSDDMNLLIDEIYESDIVLLASPSYWGDVTGQMKTFIDRSLPVCNAKTGKTPVPAGKVGVAVAVRAGNSREENQHIVDTFNHYFGHLEIQPIAVLTAEDIRSITDIENDQTKLEEAYNLGRKLKNKSKVFEQDAWPVAETIAVFHKNLVVHVIIQRRWSAPRYASMPMAKGISIDNYKLHEIEMPLAKIDGRYPACIRYPKSRIDYQQDGDMLILLIPPLLCVELFRSGVLPSKNELPKAVSIKISGKKIGDFRLFEIQYPSNYDSDRIRLKMTKR